MCAGIDWATADHVACVVDMAGRVTDRFSAAHDKAGIATMITRLRRNKVTEVAIERGDGPLVDALLGAGLTVVVITSRQVKNLRSRFGAAGAKTTGSMRSCWRTRCARTGPGAAAGPRHARDHLAADGGAGPPGPGAAPGGGLQPAARPPGRRVPGRDHAVPRPGQPDQPGVPGPVRQPGRRRGAGREAIGAWLATIAVRGRPAPASELHARLHAAPPGATGADGAAQAGVTAALTATLTALSAQIKALETQIAGQLAAHPDRHIFTSLPRPGTVRAARLLAEIGDCRSRFPDPESLAGLAGVAPVTRRSGTRIAHGFRWAVNRQLRDAICDFAADSRHASPWAAAIYDDARARGKDHPLAVRITARAWIYVIWRCWHDGTAYDPAKHNALQAVLARQAAQAAGTARQEDR